MLDKADLGYVKIMASSDLDEYIIRDLINADVSREIFGIGTRLSTGHKEAALTGVYMMSAMEEDGDIEPRMKISDEASKGNLPGKKDVKRFYDSNRMMMFDLICLADEDMSADAIAYDSMGEVFDLSIADSFEDKLSLIFQNGELLYGSPKLSDIRNYYLDNFNELNSAYKALQNPLKCGVLYNKGLYEAKQNKIKSHSNKISFKLRSLH